MNQPVMLKQANIKDLFKVNYPCYVAPIPENSTRILHIPGELEYKEFDKSYGFVLEGYKVAQGRFYVFDCIPLELWHKKKCNITYEKRLKYLRMITNEIIANYREVIDLNTQLLDNSPELYDYLDNLLTMGYKKVRIMYAYSNYVFGECSNGEYMEVEIEKVIRQRAI